MLDAATCAVFSNVYSNCMPSALHPPIVMCLVFWVLCLPALFGISLQCIELAMGMLRGMEQQQQTELYMLLQLPRVIGACNDAAGTL